MIVRLVALSAGLMAIAHVPSLGQAPDLFRHAVLEVEDVQTLSFSSDRSRLILGFDDRIQLVDPEATRIVRQFTVPGPVRHLAAGRDGQLIFFVSGKRDLYALDLIDGRVLGPTELDETVHALDATSEGLVLAAGDGGRPVLMDADLTRRLIFSSPNLYGKDIVFAAFGEGGREIVAFDGGARTATWSIDDPEAYRQSSPPRLSFQAAAVDRSGRLLAVVEERTDLVRSVSGLHARSSANVRFWDWRLGRDLREMEDIAESIGPIAWGPRGQSVFLILDGLRLGVLDVAEGELQSVIELADDVDALQSSLDGAWLAALSKRGDVELFRVGSSPVAVARGSRPIEASPLVGREKFEFTTPTDPVLPGGRPVRMAVLDLASRGADHTIADALGDFVASQLANRRHLIAVEREEVEQVLAEIRFENTGLTSAADAANIGRLLNVSVVVLGSVSQLGSSLVASARVVSVETAEIIGAREIVCNQCQIEDVPSLASLLAEALAG